MRNPKMNFILISKVSRWKSKLELNEIFKSNKIGTHSRARPTILLYLFFLVVCRGVEKLRSTDLDNVCIQHNSAMCHTSNETIDLEREKFSGPWYLSKRRSQLSTEILYSAPCDFFLWGLLRDKIFVNSPVLNQDLTSKGAIVSRDRLWIPISVLCQLNKTIILFGSNFGYLRK